MCLSDLLSCLNYVSFCKRIPCKYLTWENKFRDISSNVRIPGQFHGLSVGPYIAVFPQAVVPMLDPCASNPV